MTVYSVEPTIYRAVIDEVIQNIKSEFDDFGVSEDVLAELQSVSILQFTHLISHLPSYSPRRNGRRRSSPLMLPILNLPSLPLLLRRRIHRILRTPCTQWRTVIISPTRHTLRRPTQWHLVKLMSRQSL